jgi:short-subunit dehydrogenase
MSVENKIKELLTRLNESQQETEDTSELQEAGIKVDILVNNAGFGT